MDSRPLSVHQATSSYEAWLGLWVPLVNDDLREKHKRMREDQFGGCCVGDSQQVGTCSQVGCRQRQRASSSNANRSWSTAGRSAVIA